MKKLHLVTMISKYIFLTRLHMNFHTFTNSLILKKNCNMKYVSKRDNKKKPLPRKDELVVYCVITIGIW